MPRTGKMNWADLIETALNEIGGRGSLNEIYVALEKIPETREKISVAKSRSARAVDWRGQVRSLLYRDPRFRKGDYRGEWIIGTSEEHGPRYCLPAHYKERSEKILRMMKYEPSRTKKGWAQREIARELGLAINAVNRLVNFMCIENILEVRSGEGKTYKPYRYAPVDGVLKHVR